MKRIISLVLALCLLLGIFVYSPIMASAATSGVCGDTLTWMLDSEGTLTINGSGEMTSSPWTSYYKKIRKVVMDDTITSICGKAFYECIELSEIKLPEGLTAIGNSAFSDCAKLTNITIPKNVVNIEIDTFFSCSNLEISVDENNTSYSSIDGVLFDKSKTTLIRYTNDRRKPEYTIPEGVTTIADGAFAFCDFLTSVTFPDSVVSVGDGAFRRCWGLREVNFGIGITSISDGMFYFCENLSSITIPKGVTTIGSFAFEYCGIKKIYIPKSVVQIQDAFFNCWPTDVYYEGSAADWYNNVELTRYDEFRLNENTFHFNSTGMTSPTITNAVFTTIGAVSQIRVTLADTEYDSEMIAAFYKDGVFVIMQPVTVKAGDEAKEIPVPETIDADTAKVMIWRSMDSVKPLCEAKSVNLNEGEI